MKWIGQHIWSFISRFRSDVYLESLTTTSETSVLVVDSAGKVSKSTSVAGDLTSIVAGTGLSGTSLTGPIPTINVDAAQPGITSLGTLTALDVDNININGDTITASGDLALVATGNDITVDTDTFIIESSASLAPYIRMNSTSNNTSGSTFIFNKDRGGTPADGDVIATISFEGEDSVQSAQTYGKIIGSISDTASTDEAGRIQMKVASNSTNVNAITATGSDSDAVSVDIANGNASVTTIAGTLTMGGTAALTNVGLVAVANQSNITGVGTISSGVWEGTTIKTAYIGDDQVTEDKLANTLLAEIDANTAKVTNSDQSQADINALDITEVGALASGTIASGFGNIDNGASTLDTGAATLASLTCTAAGTFGGGYGTTGATISTAGVGQFNGALTTDLNLTCTGTVLINGHDATSAGRILIREGTDNGTNAIGFTVPAAVTTSTTFTLPDGDGSANQVLKTNGSAVLAWTDMSGGTVGWHGSGTRIKILHSDFIPDDGGRPAMIDDTGAGSEEFFLESYSSNKLYATVAIPTGYTATHVMIYGSAADAVEVWEHQINSKTGVSKGTGNVDTEINITDVASSTTNYLFIQVANASGNEVHGGYITIAES